MQLRSRRLAAISVMVLLALIGVAFFMSRSSGGETCFDRLGGPGPNSNTSRLDTSIDIPPSQWPAVADVLKTFAAERGWSLQEGPGTTDPSYFWLDMCDDKVTIVRASNQDGRSGKIGFGIIHMAYEGPANDAWQPVYRDLHRRLEARWPGRMSYIEGEFGRPIDRPAWLDQGEPDEGVRSDLPDDSQRPAR